MTTRTYHKQHVANGTQIAIVGPNREQLAVFDLDEEDEADVLVDKMNREAEANEAQQRG